MFAGLHIVGSNNNLGRTPEADAEYAARNAATLTWLRETFAAARQQDARALMLVIQANPGFELAPSARTASTISSRSSRPRPLPLGGRSCSSTAIRTTSASTNR